jgi:hypothetical protein
VYEVYGLQDGVWEFISEVEGSGTIAISMSSPSAESAHVPGKILRRGQIGPIAIVRPEIWNQPPPSPLEAAITGRDTHRVGIRLELRDSEGTLITRKSLPVNSTSSDLGYMDSDFSGTLKAYYSGFEIASVPVSGGGSVSVNVGPGLQTLNLQTAELDVRIGCKLSVELAQIEFTLAYRRTEFQGAPQFAKIQGNRVNSVLTLTGDVHGLFPSTDYGIYLVNAQGELKEVLKRNTQTDSVPVSPGRIKFDYQVPAGDPICNDINNAID